VKGRVLHIFADYYEEAGLEKQALEVINEYNPSYPYTRTVECNFYFTTKDKMKDFFEKGYFSNLVGKSYNIPSWNAIIVDTNETIPIFSVGNNASGLANQIDMTLEYLDSIIKATGNIGNNMYVDKDTNTLYAQIPSDIEIDEIEKIKQLFKTKYKDWKVYFIDTDNGEIFPYNIPSDKIFDVENFSIKGIMTKFLLEKVENKSLSI